MDILTNAPTWLPAPMLLEDYKGDLAAYLSDVYSRFAQDIKRNPLAFRGRTVDFDRSTEPPDHRERGFWHVISEGNEGSSVGEPNLLRCSRVPWIRAILQNEGDSRVTTWLRKVGREDRLHIWLEEFDYIIVLSCSKNKWFLVTAFVTDYEHTRKKHRKHREEFEKRQSR